MKARSLLLDTGSLLQTHTPTKETPFLALFGAGEGDSASDCRNRKADCLLAGVLRTLLSGAVILGTWFVTLGNEFFETSELFRLCFLP